MKKDFLNVISCPCCLGTLTLNEAQYDGEYVTNGILNCQSCQLKFEIKEEVSIFGLKRNDERERIQEIKAENDWTFVYNDIQEHVNFAKSSSKKGNEIIKFVEAFDENSCVRKKVLDVGSGWGCFQSWQFAKKGYDVTATEICPEFIFASDEVAKDCYFERVLTDCTVLPFKDQSFDIIFCKETLHHINNPSLLFDEMWRVCAPNGLIVIKEPCVSPLLKLFISRINRAKKIGITHHFRTIKEYSKLINDVMAYTIINRESFLKNSILIRRMPFSNIVNDITINALGCDIEVFGVKKMDYASNTKVSREVIPANTFELNDSQIKFYRDELIPKVFSVFC